MVDKLSIAIFACLLLLLFYNHQLVPNHLQHPSLQLSSPTTNNYTQQYLPTFAQWQLQFSKYYHTHEETLFRSQIFQRTRIEVIIHNRKYRQGKTSFSKELNRLADLTEQQFRAIYNWKQKVEIENIQGAEGPQTKLKIEGVMVTKECSGAIMDTPNPPAEIDWALTSKVTSAPDQGSCGKDWAIVSIGAVQSLYAIKIGQLQALSVQQLLECSGQYGNEGCYGGFMDQAFWYLIDYGVATVKSYPQRDVSTCRYVQNMRFTGIARCAKVPSGNFSKLTSAIVQQPVSVALDFSPDMALYKNGIFDGQCTTRLTHGMLLTGYGGKEHGTHYWIIRNTLGPTWGQKGYIHLLKEEKDGLGKCGVMSWPSLPQSLS